MQINTAADKLMIATLRRQGNRGSWLNLLSEVLDLAGGTAEFLRHEEKAWAEAMYLGARHTIALAFTGSDAIAAGEALIEALPEHEFTIPGQIVIEAKIIGVVHQTLPVPRLTIETELLLIEDC